MGWKRVVPRPIPTPSARASASVGRAEDALVDSVRACPSSGFSPLNATRMGARRAVIVEGG